VASISLLKPTNRHLLIVPHLKKNETNAGVLLPEDFKIEDDTYIEATVIDVAEDCNKIFRRFQYGGPDNLRIVIDRSMMQEIKVKDNTHHIILENYVVGIYRQPAER